MQRHIEAHVGWASGDLGSRSGGGDDALYGGLDRGRLVIELDKGSDERGLVSRRVDPIDPWPTAGRVEGPVAAEDQDREAVAVGVVDGHGGVHETDGIVNHGCHWLLGDFYEAVGDGDRVFFVKAEDDFWVSVAIEVGDAVVQAAEAGAWHKGDILEVQAAELPDHGVAAVNDLRRGGHLVTDQRLWELKALVPI